MTSDRKEFIDESVPLSEIVAEIRDICGREEIGPVESKTLERLGFIQLRYVGFTMREACETIGISLQTGYNWQNSWNEDRLESLHPKYAGGRPSRLDDDDKRILAGFVMSGYPSTRDVGRFISDRFGIDYSEKQVHTIMKSLGFEHVSEKKLGIVLKKAPGDSAKALMRWVAPDGRHGLSRN